MPPSQSTPSPFNNPENHPEVYRIDIQIDPEIEMTLDADMFGDAAIDQAAIDRAGSAQEIDQKIDQENRQTERPANGPRGRVASGLAILLQEAAAAALRHCGLQEAALTVVLTHDEEVQQLNRDYRGMDAPTDVLSFATHADTATDASNDVALPPEPEIEDELAIYLGDILIAYPYAMRQAAHYTTAPGAELRLLVVHGTLHLAGYDHDTPAAEAAMWQAQEAILAQFGDQGLSFRRYDAS